MNKLRISLLVFRKKFPDAEKLNFTDPPNNEILNGDGKWIQIFIVKAAFHEDREGKLKIWDPKMPPNVRRYQENNNINLFVYSKPVPKGSKEFKNEFQGLWYLNYFFETQDAFPTIHRRSEIISRSTTETTPLENAIRSVESKNDEILQMIARYTTAPTTNVNPFTMLLSGVLDPNVNGGTKVFAEAFCLPSNYNPTNEFEQVNKLKAAIKHQDMHLIKAVKLHAAVCPQALAALQERLEKSLQDYHALCNTF